MEWYWLELESMKQEFVTTEKGRKMKNFCCTYNSLQNSVVEAKTLLQVVQNFLHGTVGIS